MPAHARPRRPVPLAPVLAGAVLAVLMVGGLVVALSRSDHETVASSQASPVPQTTPVSASPQRACERDVVQALTRTFAWLRGGGSSDMAVAEERQRLDPVAYSAYAAVLNDFMEDTQPGLANRITAVMPAVRRVCSSATSG